MEMDDPRNEYQEFLSAIEDNASGGSFTNALIHLQYKYRLSGDEQNRITSRGRPNAVGL